MTSKTFYGRFHRDAISADLALRAFGPRMRHLVPDAGSLAIKLPDARTCRTGGQQFLLVNAGSYELDITDDGDNVLAALPAGQSFPVYLVENSTANGSWIIVDGVTYSRIATVTVSDPTGNICVFSGTLEAETDFSGDISSLGDVEFSGTLQSTTAFSGAFGEGDVEFGGSLSIPVEFTGNFAVYPVSNIVSSTAGGGGDGTIGTPWTLAEAGAALSPGDVCHLRGGEYPETSACRLDTVNATVVSGTAGNAITYRAYPGETPIINGLFRLGGTNYLTFEDLTFHTSNDAWIYYPYNAAGHTNQTFTRCSFSSTPGVTWGSGILVYGGENFRFDDCTFGYYWNYDTVHMYDTDGVIFDSCDFIDAFAPRAVLNLNDASNVIIRDSIFRNWWAGAINIRTDTTGTTVLIENCVLVDTDWTTGHGVPSPLPTGWSYGTQEVCRTSILRTIVRNCIFVGSGGGNSNRSEGYDYAGALAINLYGDFNDAHTLRVYNNVFHSNRLNAISFIKNDSAGSTNTQDNRFYNNSLSGSSVYELLVTHSDFQWESWLFDTNRVYNAVTNKKLFIAGAPQEAMTVAEAEAQHSNVFKNSITSAPQFVMETLFATVQDDAEAIRTYDIDDWFSAFSEDSSSPGFQSGRQLAKVTANATSDTITVDDAYVFWATHDLLAGDSILIGANSAVTVLEILSATSILVSASITVAIDDAIYLERTGLTPNIGLMQIGTASSETKTFSGTASIATVFAGNITMDTLLFSGTLTSTTSFTGDFIKPTDDLFQITHEGGTSAEYDTFVDDAGDLSVSAAAALDSTNYGLSVYIDGVGSIYGAKSFTWDPASDVLRWRFYLDPNSLTMANYDSFNIQETWTPTGYITNYVALTKISGTYKIRLYTRDDGGTWYNTAWYNLSDAEQSIECEMQRASSAVASDGHLKLWIDDVLQETVSSLDVYDQTRASQFVVGAVRNIDVGTLGAFYIDEIIVRETSTPIGV